VYYWSRLCVRFNIQDIHVLFKASVLFKDCFYCKLFPLSVTYFTVLCKLFSQLPISQFFVSYSFSYLFSQFFVSYSLSYLFHSSFRCSPVDTCSSSLQWDQNTSHHSDMERSSIDSYLNNINVILFTLYWFQYLHIYSLFAAANRLQNHGYDM